MKIDATTIAIIAVGYFLLKDRGGVNTGGGGGGNNIPQQPPKNSPEWVKWVQLVLATLAPYIIEKIKQGNKNDPAVKTLFQPGGPFYNVPVTYVAAAWEAGINPYTNYNLYQNYWGSKYSGGGGYNDPFGGGYYPWEGGFPG